MLECLFFSTPDLNSSGSLKFSLNNTSAILTIKTLGLTGRLIAGSQKVAITNSPGNYTSTSIAVDTSDTVLEVELKPVASATTSAVVTTPNTKITGVTSWDTLSPRVKVALSSSSALTSVPDQGPLTSDYSGLFDGCSTFNQDISSWDTSHVTDMRNIFNGCSAFNKPLNTWNVSNVTNMNGVFYGCSVFNQPLNNWIIDSCTSMAAMFYNCAAFNQNINGWNTGNITTMNQVFSGCSAFNQPLNNWNISRVKTMTMMFYNCTNFNQDISGWDTSSVLSMNYMFYSCSNFNRTISNWNVSKVTDITSMFANCKVYNQNLSSMIFKSTVVRNSYDSGATAWLAGYRPKFTG